VKDEHPFQRKLNDRSLTPRRRHRRAETLRARRLLALLAVRPYLVGELLEELYRPDFLTRWDVGTIRYCRLLLDILLTRLRPDGVGRNGDTVFMGEKPTTKPIVTRPR